VNITSLYRMVQKAFPYNEPFGLDHERDRQTDGLKPYNADKLIRIKSIT